MCTATSATLREQRFPTIPSGSGPSLTRYFVVTSLDLAVSSLFSPVAMSLLPCSIALLSRLSFSRPHSVSCSIPAYSSLHSTNGHPAGRPPTGSSGPSTPPPRPCSDATSQPKASTSTATNARSVSTPTSPCSHLGGKADLRPCISGVEDLVQRCERGLLSYDAYSVEELTKFAEDRGYYVVPPSTKKELVQLLEKADDDIKFEKVLELPAELRNRIYGAYFEALGVLPQKLTQPPLCSVSRQIRAESLPVFYATATFQLRFVHTYTGPHNDPRPPFEDNGYSITRLTKHTQALRAGVTDEKLAQIKRTAVVVTASWLGTTPEVWKVDLGERCDFGKSQRVAAVGAIDGRRWFVKLTNGLEELVKELVAKAEGTEKLVKSDIEKMRKVIHDGLTK